MEIKALTGIRGIAAFTVFVAHYEFFNRIPFTHFLNALFRWHAAAVDLFFILSGFILCVVYKAGSKEKLDYRKYGLARISRIYPLYCLTLLFTAFFVFYRPFLYHRYPFDIFLVDFIGQLIMVNAWPVCSGVHFNFPSWSVSIEFFCYIFIFPILYRFKPSLSIAAVMTVLMTCTAVSALLFLNFIDPDIVNPFVGKRHDEIVFWLAIIRGVTGFTAGWVIYLCYDRKDALFHFTNRHIDLLVLCFIGVLVVAYFIRPFYRHIGVVLFPFIIMGLSRPSDSISQKVFTSKTMLFLGDCSYSIYLWHIPVRFVSNFFYPQFADNHPIVWSITHFSFVMAVSYASFRYIEVPCRNFIRQMGGLPSKKYAARFAEQ